MLEQGGGYMLNVASAAGLLVIPDTVSYTVAKHAAVGFTEWVATMYGDRGTRVSLANVSAPLLAARQRGPSLWSSTGPTEDHTHVLPKGNYVIAGGNYLIANPSNLGNFMIADNIGGVQRWS
jgi:NAD(P)-dependent dehydrogenase (short-subunit alcohol dehydrogenase family)